MDLVETHEESEYSLVAHPEPPTPCLFNDADGDVLLRTPDGKDFQVSKVILKFASPVFTTMFSPPQPSAESSPTLPIIPVSETNATIDLLLRLIYPVESPDLAKRGVAVVFDVLLATKKYEIDFLLSPVREAFRKCMETNKTDAMVGFALASHRKLDLEVRTATKACLKWPIGQIRDVVVPELGLISALDYLVLMKYHERAGQVVADLFTSSDFLLGPCSLAKWFRCPCASFVTIRARRPFNGYAMDVYMRPWWATWSDLLIAALRNAPLGTDIISLSTLSPVLLKRKDICETCQKTIFDEWIMARDAMIDAIKNEVDKVNMSLPLP